MTRNQWIYSSLQFVMFLISLQIFANYWRAEARRPLRISLNFHQKYLLKMFCSINS